MSLAFSPLTWNADRAEFGDGLQRTRFSVKWRNWLGVDGSWRPIKLWSQFDSGRASITHAPYLLDCPGLANGQIRFESTCRWDLWSKTVLTDQARGVTKRYLSADPVRGVLSPSGMLYAGAFPHLNADLLIQPHEQKVRHLTVFHSAPPGTGPVVIPFEIDADGERPTWSPRGGFSFARGAGLRGVGFKRARVWDSAGRSSWIHVRIYRERGRLVCSKIIPRAFFASAVHPVFTDTTSTFYPDPDPESTSVDGEAQRDTPAGETFASIQGGNGNASNSVLSTAFAGRIQQGVGTFVNMRRGLWLFDTSALPDTDTINSATFSLYGSINSNSTGSQSIDVVQGTTGSDTALASSDFEVNVGNTTQFATPITIGSWSTSGYNDLALNATGRAAITKTGVTKFCTRCSGDRANSQPPPGGGADDGVIVFTADETGTSKDPKLVVDHTAAATPTLVYSNSRRTLNNLMSM